MRYGSAQGVDGITRRHLRWEVRFLPASLVGVDARFGAWEVTTLEVRILSPAMEQSS